RAYREHSWGFESEPDDRGVSEPLLRGRLVGGTSWVTRFAMRGSPADFDLWARLGNDGWAFDDVLPWFVRAERDLDSGGLPWHGDAGPLPITRYPEVAPSEYEVAVAAALAANGFPTTDDHNRPGALGTGRMPRNGHDGRRVTAADALLPVDDAPANLHVRADAEVDALLLDGATALGVRLVDGTEIRAGHVVLSAGTYGSPTILLRSGIGPADHLRDVGVPVHVDLPGVGANLADHPGVDVDPGYRSDQDAGPRIFTLTTFHSSGHDTAEAPDLALWTYDPFGEPAETTVDVLLLTPRSRGTVRLRSADPSAPPRITLPGLSDPADVDVLVEGYRRAYDVAAHAALRSVCAGAPPPLPAAVDQLGEQVRRTVGSFPHVVGTCAMGRDPGRGAVVDPYGGVHGVDRLSVVDASIFPTAPSGFPHLISVMVAERLADHLSRTL
ncbi:MAG: choline dehydrogenase, partial [Actinomycetota bacterium]|nr:choline dehydrogenase [Actinomycetota bacterium]